MERLVGKYCKIVTKEPGEERASVVTGILEDVDYKDGFILVDSSQGLGCLRINTIVAIKPGHKRNKEKPEFKDDEVGIVGIGTLIVFIAMILVAAVAASVLIQTSETLQQRAQSVSTNTIREVSAGLVIDNIIGYTNANNTRITHMAISIRPRAGSKDIDLSLCTLTVLYEQLNVLTLDTSLVVEVNLDSKSVFQTPLSSGSSTTLINSTTNMSFAVLSVHDPDGSVNNTNGLNSGDRVYVIMNLSALIPNTNDWTYGGLPSRETISGAMQPETGAKAVYDITAPAVFSKRIVQLW